MILINNQLIKTPQANPKPSAVSQLVDSLGRPLASEEEPSKEEMENFLVSTINNMIDDIKNRKRAASEVDKRVAWGFMLRSLDEGTLLYAAHADRQNKQDLRVSALCFLTEQAIALVHGIGKKKWMPDVLTEDQIRQHGEAVPYVQYCCQIEILRRHGFIARFEPAWDVLDREQAKEEIEISDQGKQTGWKLFRERFDKDMQEVKRAKKQGNPN